MGASPVEREGAQTHGVTIHLWLTPVEIIGEGGQVVAVRFARQALVDGRLQATGEDETFAADMVLKAIGQKLDADMLGDSGLTLRQGRIVADDDGRTSAPGLYVGGDCRLGGRDLTVEAVEDGKRAARAIHTQLCA